MKFIRNMPAAVHVCIGWRMLALLFAAVFIAASPPALAQGEAGSNGLERSVKAAFLYKFLGYIDWPPSEFASRDAPMVIGVAGADTVAAELAQIAAGRTVNGRPVSVRKLAAGDALTGIHMLFIGRGELARQGQWLRMAQQHPIVSVTESDNALEQGSIINFKVADNRVRFDVSLVAAEKNGLKLSSRMLAVASTVQTGARQ